VRAGCPLLILSEYRGSAGAPNTVIDNVEGSRPAAAAIRRNLLTASPASKPGAAIGNQPSPNSTTRFNVWSVQPPNRIGGCGLCLGFG
jgi:hypothetical protein